MESDPKPQINYIREAFVLPINLVFLTVTIVAALTMFFTHFTYADIGGELLLIMSIALEMFYLAILPNNRRFIKTINSIRFAEVNAIEREVQTLTLLPSLSDDSIKKFTLFKQKRGQLVGNMNEKIGSTSSSLVETIVQKMDTLEFAYAQNLYSLEKYYLYFQNSSTTQLQSEIDDIKNQMSTASEKVKPLLQNRMDLINKRVEKMNSIKENIQIAVIQIKTIEDTLNYLFENSFTPANANNFIEMIDNIVVVTDSSQEALKEVDALFSNMPSTEVKF